MLKSIMLINITMIIIMSMISMMINLIPSHNKEIHPIMMSFILFIFSIFSSMNLSIYMNSHWFSFIMFLILIGGMMILFLYFTSFISNIKMTIKWNYIYMIPIKFLLMSMLIMIMLLIMNKYFNWYNNYNEIYSLYNLIKMNMFNDMNMYTYMYMYNKNYSTLISMLYLLLCLTLIVKMCINKKLSVRKMN